MKSIRSLCMILIGMISFTTLATTPVLEQKQKPVVTVEITQSVPAVVVQEYTTNLEAESYSNLVAAIEAKPLFLNVPVINTYAIVLDVGWRSNAKDKLQFKEKVLSRAETYNLSKHQLKTIPKSKPNIFHDSIIIRNYS